MLVLGGQYDPTTPPEAARQAVSAVPGARFAEFAGSGTPSSCRSACSRQMIAAFLDDPAATAARATPAPRRTRSCVRATCSSRPRSTGCPGRRSRWPSPRSSCSCRPSSSSRGWSPWCAGAAAG
ncbi:alpha/beta hydrolase [Microbispora sp. GKU 823]|uniref:alpha/beta hydrolase n=1 Tax=Microbispora sp. GKU 823 TaxID=1652100 RepID=UPI0035648878